MVIKEDAPYVSTKSMGDNGVIHTIVVQGADLKTDEVLLNDGSILSELLNRVSVLLFEWDHGFKTTLEERRTIWDQSR
jgi:hypothetical protein